MRELLALSFYTACFFTLFALLAFAYGLACRDFNLILQAGGFIIAGLFVSGLLACSQR